MERDTIVEAIFELRFKPRQDDVGDLLPGLLYPALKAAYPELVRLPLAELPKQVRKSQPNLSYTPIHQMKGDGQIVSIGDQVVTVSVQKPYPGWGRFKSNINQVLTAVRDSGVAEEVGRVSMRYANIVAAGQDAKDLSPYKVQFKLSSIETTGIGTHLRSEANINGCTAVMQIATGANSQLPDGKVAHGVLIDVDILMSAGVQNFWTDTDAFLNTLHDTEKQIFFGLLEESTIDFLGPRWSIDE